MKTQTILATLAAALFATGSAVASDPIDNHHGSFLYPSRPTQAVTTVAFGGHAERVTSNTNTVTRTNSDASDAKLIFREVTTPHGVVSYYAPAL